MNIKIIKLIAVLFLLFPNLNSYSNSKKETLKKRVSFFYIKSNKDSIKKGYDLVRKLYIKNEYTLALNKGLYYINKYSKISSTIEEDESIYGIYFFLAETYRKTDSQTNSLFYYKKALVLLLKDQKKIIDDNLINFDNEKLTKLYLKIGNNYLSSGKVDSAKIFYNKTFNTPSLSPKSLASKASAYSNLAGIYMLDSIYDLAKNYSLKSIEIHAKLNNKISEAVAFGSLASIYLSEDNFNKAKETYKKALDIIKNLESDRALRVRENLYYNLAYNLYKLEDHEAYTYQERSYIIKDSLRDKEIRKIIEELGFKYNFESKKEIFDKEVENKRLKAQRTFIAIGLVALIIIFSLLYWVKINRLKLQKSEFIKNQELSKIKSESQSRILNATIDGKESERKEIAETLHDSVSALLSSANLHLQATRKQFNGKTPIEIDKTQEIITEATQQIRDLSHTLVSSVLLKFGLNFAITDIADKYSNSELKINTNIQDLRRYHQKFEIKVYNIIQEFINNILKHSKAKNAVINLKDAEGVLILKIIDDGVGFDKTKINLKDGLGINQIDARIQMMQGYFFIESSFNSGTTIFVKLPVVEKEVKSHVYPIQ